MLVDMVATHLSPPEAGRTPKYPWTEWLDGHTWTLVRGRDYWGTNAEFGRRLRGAANARSLRYKVNDADPNFLTLRAYPNDRPADG
jgi:hypothetical protein